MKIEINISDEKIRHLNENGKSELIKKCKKYGDEIMDEASRLEASRNDTENHEITSALINDAVIHIKRFPTDNKINWWIKIIQIIAFLSSLIAGSLFDSDKLKDTNQLIWFAVTLFLSTAATVYVTFNSGKNG